MCCNYWDISVLKFEVKGLSQGAMMLFLVTEKSPISVRMRDDDVTGNFWIANEGDLSKKQRADRI